MVCANGFRLGMVERMPKPSGELKSQWLFLRQDGAWVHGVCVDRSHAVLL